MAALIIGLIIANSPSSHGLFAVKDLYLSIDFLNLDLSVKQENQWLTALGFDFDGRPIT